MAGRSTGAHPLDANRNRTGKAEKAGKTGKGLQSTVSNRWRIALWGLAVAGLAVALAMVWWRQPHAPTTLTVINRGALIAELQLGGAGLLQPVRLENLAADARQTVTLALAERGPLLIAVRAERHAVTNRLLDDVSSLRGEALVLEAGPGARYVLLRDTRTAHSR
jgi:hypothetical protein